MREKCVQVLQLNMPNKVRNTTTFIFIFLLYREFDLWVVTCEVHPSLKTVTSQLIQDNCLSFNLSF